MPNFISQKQGLKMWAAFAAVYFIWGSTFLAMRCAIASIPPFMMAGTRFLVAGAALYAWSRARGAPRPSGVNWLSALVLGALLFLQGNGIVAWSEQRVSSGLTALMLTTIPLWMAILGRTRSDRKSLRPQVILGLILGLIGIAVLVGPREWAGSARVDLVGAIALLFASISWVAGSLYSRTARLPPSPLMSAGTQMLAGGALLLGASAISGEASRLRLAALSMLSVLSLAYLISFGSIVAFTAYLWLLRKTSPARVGTYAFVNPLVALFLGWGLGGRSHFYARRHLSCLDTGRGGAHPAAAERADGARRRPSHCAWGGHRRGFALSASPPLLQHPA